MLIPLADPVRGRANSNETALQGLVCIVAVTNMAIPGMPPPPTEVEEVVSEAEDVAAITHCYGCKQPKWQGEASMHSSLWMRLPSQRLQQPQFGSPIDSL